jgi:transposase
MPVSAVSSPANGDERKQVAHLIETVEVKMGKPGRPPKKIKRIAGDKGYDSQKLREFLLSKGITLQIPRKSYAKPQRGRPMLMSAPRFQIERTFSWLQRKFRRLAVRWERLPRCFDSFLSSQYSQYSNNSIGPPAVPSSISTGKLNVFSPYHRKVAYALELNVKSFVETVGLDRLGFLTLTFPDNCTDHKEAYKRFRSFNANYLANHSQFGE